MAMSPVASLSNEQRELAERNVGLTRSFAHKYIGRYKPLSKKEVLSAAQLGLIRAASLWTGTADCEEFVFFAWNWMQHHARSDQRDACRFTFRFRQFPEFSDVARVDDGQEPVNWQELADKLNVALANMKPKYREVVELRMSGMSVTRIAEVKGCTKQRVSQILRKEFGKIAGPIGRLPTIVYRKKVSP